MERIAGINDVRPGLTSYIESAKGGTPVVITVNSEPQAVLVGYERYRELEKASIDVKRLALAMSVADLRARAASSGLTASDVEREIAEHRRPHEGSR
ncbi:MAG: type II toxin-antitoxin system Phd/YefM family antitoxin [Bacillota bacterium]